MFFQSDWPQGHRKDLLEWRTAVVNEAPYEDKQFGPGTLIFIYEQNNMLMEALHLLLLEWKDSWLQMKDATQAQMEKERKAWHYFPKELSKEGLVSPFKELDACFKQLKPQHYRDNLNAWLHTAMANHEADETLPAGDIIRVYDNMLKFYDIGWLIYKRYIEEPEEAEDETPLTDNNEEIKSAQIQPSENTELKNQLVLSTAERLGLEKVKERILDKIPSVRMITCIGKHVSPFTYYLVILIDDSEKTPEHEVANKIEDNCKILTSVFAIVHKAASAKEGIQNGRRFWNNVVPKGVIVYQSETLELPNPNPVSEAVWKERAQRNWERWGTQGKEFLKGAEHYIANGNYTLGLFMLHQAAESSLIAINQAKLGYRISVHNLARMLRLTLLFTEDIKRALNLETPKGVEGFNLLQTGYTEARYKSTFEPDRQSVLDVKGWVEGIIASVNNIYNSSLIR